MKLRAIDQVHISSVQADSLRPGQEFEVSDDLGTKMLKSLPGQLEAVADAADPAPAEKAEQPHDNKAEPAAPANKAAPKRKTKGN